MGVTCESCYFSYQAGTPLARAALQNITLSPPEDEWTCLIGHTGCGKSTLLMLLSGLLKPDSGALLLDGENIWTDKNARRSLKKKVGLVFQYPEYQLFEETVLQDVMFGPINLGFSKPEAEEKAKWGLSQVGMGPEFYELSPFALSGGQKRRAAIAGVLAMEPDILLMDEPTAGLDPAAKEELLTLMKRWQVERGLTLVVSSHDMEEVAQRADLAVVMKEGKILFEGTPGETFSQEDLLREAGLSLPAGCRIAKRCREAKIPIPGNPLTVREVTDAICQTFQARFGQVAFKSKERSPAGVRFAADGPGQGADAAGGEQRCGD